LLQHFVNKRGFAMINVCDDGYVSNFLNHRLASVHFVRPLQGMSWRQRFFTGRVSSFQGACKTRRVYTRPPPIMSISYYFASSVRDKDAELLWVGHSR
jgi:hypothetical protein